MKTRLLLLPVLVLLFGCQGLWNSVVTFKDVTDAAMKDWAEASVTGKTTPAMDTAVKAAYANVQKAAGIAADALTAYKAGGSQNSYINALAAVRLAVGNLIDLITPSITPQKATALQTMLKKAVQ